MDLHTTGMSGTPAEKRKRENSEANEDYDGHSDSADSIVEENLPPNLESIVIPKGENNPVFTAILGSLKRIDGKIDSIKKEQTRQALDIERPGGISDRLCILEDETGFNAAEVAQLRQVNKDLRYEISLIKSYVIKQDEHLNCLHEQVLDLRSRSMKNNILFHNVPEKDRENITETVKNILEKDLKMTNVENVEIDNAHRLGEKRFVHNRKPRPVIVRFQKYTDASKILDIGRNLYKDKPYVQGQIRVTPQFPTEILEKRRELGEIASKKRESAPAGQKVDIKMSLNKLTINGQVHRDKLPKPGPKVILNMTAIDDMELEQISTYQGDTVSEGGSTFVATIATTNSVDEARQLYKKVLRNPEISSATHNICAYRNLDPLTTKTTSHWQDDGEHGAGRYAAKCLQEFGINKATVIVTRYYGGKHLGYRRFELIRDAIKKAWDKMRLN